MSPANVPVTNASSALYTDVSEKSFSTNAMPCAAHRRSTFARVIPCSWCLVVGAHTSSRAVWPPEAVSMVCHVLQQTRTAWNVIATSTLYVFLVSAAQLTLLICVDVVACERGKPTLHMKRCSNNAAIMPEAHFTTMKKLTELQVATNPCGSSISPSFAPALLAATQAVMQLSLECELRAWSCTSGAPRRTCTVLKVMPCKPPR